MDISKRDLGGRDRLTGCSGSDSSLRSIVGSVVESHPALLSISLV